MVVGMRIFLNILAIVMLFAYMVVGINSLGMLGFDMDSPLAFFSMLPTWPFSLLVYAFILDPIRTAMDFFLVIVGLFLFCAMLESILSGEFARMKFPTYIPSYIILR